MKKMSAEEVSLKLYDIARRNMRNYGRTMPLGREAFQHEMAAEVQGTSDGMDYEEYAKLSNYDFFQCVFMRLLLRVPDKGVREAFFRNNSASNKKYKLGFLKSVIRSKEYHLKHS